MTAAHLLNENLESAVKSSDLSLVMEKRSAREYGKTIHFGCQCWNACADRLQRGPHPVEVAVLEHVQKLASNIILTCLTEGMYRF